MLFYMGPELVEALMSKVPAKSAVDTPPEVSVSTHAGEEQEQLAPFQHMTYFRRAFILAVMTIARVLFILWAGEVKMQSVANMRVGKTKMHRDEP
jgi:hypothetical protein